MHSQRGIDRRAFLRRAGATAVLGAVGARTSLAAEPFSPLADSSGRDFDFDEILPRFGTDSTKWDGAVASYGEGIEVGMGIADMDFRAAPCITRALADRMAHENWGYLRTPPDFIPSIAAWERRRMGVDIDPSNIVLANGVHLALIAGYHAFVPPGQRILMTTPVYSGFYGSQRFARVVAEESPMILQDGRYSIDWDDFERRVRGSAVFLLCNPHNPTGNCWSREDLLRIGQICLDNRVLVFSDEIHCDLVPPGAQFTPFASLPNQAIVDNSITFKAVSKTFNLPGLKVAWYYSTNSALLERIRATTRSDLSTPAILATRAGIQEGDEWLDALLPYLGANQKLAEEYIRENIPLVKYRAAEGTYLAWLDVTALAERVGVKEMAAEQSIGATNPVAPEQVMVRWIADNARIAVNGGNSYGPGGENHLRVNLALPRALVQKALSNLAEAAARA